MYINVLFYTFCVFFLTRFVKLSVRFFVLFRTEVNIPNEKRHVRYILYHITTICSLHIHHTQKANDKHFLFLTPQIKQKLIYFAHHSSFACKIHTKRQLFVPYTSFFFYLNFFSDLKNCSFFICLCQWNEWNEYVYTVSSRAVWSCWILINQWKEFDCVESFRR